VQPEVVNGSGSIGCRLRGELTVESAPALVEALGALARERGAPHMVIDLREVSYIDSTCLSALIEARRGQEQHGGTLSVLVEPGGHVSDLFRITGTRETLGVRDDADGPLESLVF
jgi:stage II sporulation protein AA (anti-sigma F factor antagonist)